MSENPKLILITGVMAAGKSSVAQGVAERLPKSVHLRGDGFRRMIVNGRADMGFELSADALDQLRLRYRIAATVAEIYLHAGFTVVYQDIIIGPALSEVVQSLQHLPLHVVVLCPDPAIVAERDAARGKRGYPDAAVVESFGRVLRTETPRLGLWLDSSILSVSETVDYILSNLHAARIQAISEPSG